MPATPSPAASPHLPPECCSYCGAKTSLAGSYLRQRRSFSRTTQLVCPPCLVKQRTASHWSKLWWWLFVAASGATLVWAVPEFPLSWFLVNLAWLDVCLIATIAPHELAHAFAGHGVGFRVFRVFIGSGRTWWRGRLFGFQTELKVFPFDGAVVALPRETARFRRRRFLFILAGPLANAALLALAVAAVPPGVSWTDSFSVRWAGWPVFALANAVVLLLNLWPRTIQTALGPVRSDGRNLWNVLFYRPKDTTAAHALWFQLEACECREHAARPAALAWLARGLALYPENNALLRTKTLLHIELGELAAARAILLPLLADTAAPPLRAVLLNDLAYVDALLGGEALLAEADHASAEALAAFPWSPAIQNTRGTFLLAAGRLAEALPILRTSRVRPEEDPSASAQTACLLALAEAQSGHTDAARRLRAEAHRHDPLCFLLPRVDAALPPQT